MTTHRKPIMGFGIKPDVTGECYFPPVDVEMTLGTGLMKNIICTLKDPSADTGFHGMFKVPKNYIGTPKIVITGIIDGTVGSTSVDFEFSYVSLANNESIETGWVESVTWDSGNTSGWTTEDLMELVSGALGSNFSVDDQVFFYMKRDYGTDDFVGDFHVTALEFEYNDA